MAHYQPGAPGYGRFIREDIDWKKLNDEYTAGEPFHHAIIDNFFLPEIAEELQSEFPPIDDPVWRPYNNKIEVKKLLNHWDKFKPLTYRTLAYLNSEGFMDRVRELSGLSSVMCDIGLNGGGWHIHGRGGKLNVHMDYSVHPKLALERRLNLIVYLTKDWLPEWGGALELWSHDEMVNKPKAREKSVDCVFNRAVLFDTTMNSWHGLPEELNCPEGILRRSLAVYYLTPPRENASDRGKALFAPHKEQANDPEILELIKQRSSVTGAASVYEK